MANWNPFNNAYSNYPLVMWDKATWRQRVLIVTVWTVTTAVIIPASFVAGIVIIGMVIEGVAQHNEQLDRCRRQAATPYEYHQCR